jgi:uncharacterized protein YndB with AHSA1/START domain
MTLHRERVLRIERMFDAPVERVFEAWTSEEVLRRWLNGMPGWETPTAEVDLRVGGRIRIVMRNPIDGAESGATGEYTVVEPLRRLVFTWIWDHDPDRPQLIELEFDEQDGQTRVRMTNSAIPTDGTPPRPGARLARVLRQPRLRAGRRVTSPTRRSCTTCLTSEERSSNGRRQSARRSASGSPW